MKIFLSTALILLLTAGCKTPGTNTGNPDGPVNTSPGTQPPAEVLRSLAEFLCDFRRNCYQRASSNCVDDLMTTPNLAGIFSYPTNANTWREIAEGLSAGTYRLKISATYMCGNETSKVTCSNPQAQAALDQTDFSNLDVFFNTSPTCRSIIQDPNPQ